MSDSHDHHILDGCLEELLGGETPPDLKDQILTKWQTRQASAQAATDQPHLTATLSTNGQSVTSRFIQRKRRGKKNVVPIAVGAIVLIAVAATALLIFNGVREGPMVDRPDEKQSVEVSEAPHRGGTGQDEPPRPAPEEAPSDDSGSPSLVVDDDDSDLGPDPGFGPPRDSDTVTPPLEVAQPPSSYSTDTEVVAMIDQLLEAAWREHGVRPAPPASDGQWVRRVYIRLLGRIPSVGERNRFVRSGDRNKRAQLLTGLLDSPEFVDQYAEHWADVWANALVGRSVENTISRREGLLDYLRQSLTQNVSYDRLVNELITAKGSNDPHAEDYNGATNFLLGLYSDRKTLITARTSQVFLGQRLQCAQCHDHPFDETQQLTYWQLNSFFRQLQPLREGQYTRLVDADFAGEGKEKVPTEAEVYFQRPNGEMNAAYPGHIDGTEGSRSGRVKDVIRRQAFARHLVASPELSRAVVNRLWGHFFGYGFVNPVDDMGIHNPPSHPELLEKLAQEFAGHQYDLKRLIMWIASSEAFSLSGRSLAGSTDDDPAAGRMALFSRYYPRQMQPEEVFRSMQLLAQASQPDNLELLPDRQAWLAQFVRSLETDEGDEVSSFDGDIPQTLIIMNGPLTRQIISIEEGSLLRRLADNQRISTRAKIAVLFQATYSRNPSRNEYAGVERSLRDDPSVETLQDLWWALLNSSEFILDH